MRYLVTGGAGFIGSNIVEELLKRGERVRVLDNFSTGRRENIEPFLSSIEFIEGDVRSYHIVREAVDGVDVVLHQAALPSVPRSIKDPITTNEVNVAGTLNVLNAMRDAKVKRMVFASSSSIYGDTPELPKHEGMTPNPLSPYAVSKLAGEKYCQVFVSVYGMECVALRYFNVFGPRQDPNSQYSAVIPRFIKAIFRGEQPIIYGDGEQSRDFTYVDNIVVANILAATSTFGNIVTLNCACHQQITLNKVVDLINALAKTDLKPRYESPRPGDIKHSYADIRLIQETLSFNPTIQFAEGLRCTAEWFRAAR